MYALPSELVEMIFGKLMLVYGTRFVATYAGQDPGRVRQHWAQELSGFKAADITWALEHLPAEQVPNVLQFRDIARRSPPEALRAIEAPKASPERVRELVAGMQGLQAPLTQVERWRRVLANARSTRTAKEMAHTALRRLGAEG